MDREANEFEQELATWAETLVQIIDTLLWMQDHGGFDKIKTQLILKPPRPRRLAQVDPEPHSTPTGLS